MTPRSPLSFNGCFGGTYRLHFQGRRNRFSKPAVVGCGVLSWYFAPTHPPPPLRLTCLDVLDGCRWCSFNLVSTDRPLCPCRLALTYSGCCILLGSLVPGRPLPAERNLFAEPISSILKMEAIFSSETSVETQRTTRRHIPEDDTLQNHRCENLKSYMTVVVYIIIWLFSGALSTARQCSIGKKECER
jgi:hypothetical protein